MYIRQTKNKKSLSYVFGRTKFHKKKSIDIISFTLESYISRNWDKFSCTVLVQSNITIILL